MGLRVKGHSPAHTRPPSGGPPPGGSFGQNLPTRMAINNSGTQYYWDPVSGSDSNNGLAANTAWKTAPYVVANVPLGSIVNVIGNGVTITAGSNVDAFRWNRAGGDTAQPTTFRAVTNRGITFSTGLAANSTTIKYSLVISRGAVRLEGFKIGGRGYDSSNGEGNVGIRLDNTVTAAFSGVEFYDCEITGCGGQGVYSVSAAPNDITDVWFYRCLFHDNALDARAGLSINLDGYYGNKGTHHMYIGDDQGNDPSVQKGGYHFVVASCIFKGNMPGRHVQMGAQARNFIITSNTFYGNTGLPMNGVPESDFGGGNCEFFCAGSGAYRTGNCIVVNNIIANAKGAGAYGSGDAMSGNLVTNNLPYSLNCVNSAHDGWDPNQNWPNLYGYPGGAQLYTVGTNLTEADPKFTDPTNGNFVLLAGSPAIGTADLTYSPVLDYAGNNRNTSTPNIGAF